MEQKLSIENLFEEKYLCFCNDCKKSFYSETIPTLVHKKNLFTKKRIQKNKTDIPKHCMPVDESEHKSSVRCTYCKGSNVMLCSIID